MTGHHRDERAEFAHYLGVLRRGASLIMATVALATVSAVVFSFHQDRLYSATAEVLLSNQNLANALSGVPTQPVDPRRSAQTQAELARVPTVALGTLRAAGLKNRTPQQFLENSSAAANPSADLVALTVKDSDPLLAARLATLYAREYMQYRRKLDTAPLVAARSEVASKLRTLEKTGNRRSALYRSLLDKDQQLATMQALQTSNAVVVRNADPGSLVQPRPARNALLGFLLGLLLGAGLAYMREALDTRVRSTEELEEKLGLPLLARLAEPPRRLSADRPIMLEAPQSPEAEAFRVLATNLELANLDRGARTIMLASARQAEGKSTTAANLAVALGLAGRRVVLVDLDLRQPSIARHFGLGDRLGVTDVVLGHADLEEALVTISLPGSHLAGGANQDGSILGTLEVLTSGELPPSAGEFARSGALPRILAQLVERADLVLIDVPPLLDVGDPIVLSAYVDALLVVARLSHLQRPEVNDLVRALSGSPARALGLVITGAEVDYSYAHGRYAAIPSLRMPLDSSGAELAFSHVDGRYLPSTASKREHPDVVDGDRHAAPSQSEAEPAAGPRDDESDAVDVDRDDEDGTTGPPDGPTQRWA